jgi:NAD(P)H-nitrite reductase large subunit
MARRAKLRLSRPTQFHEVAGKGVDAEIDGIRVLVGRASWLSDPAAGLDAASIAAIDEIQRSSEADGLSVLYVVKEGRLAGWIGLEVAAAAREAGTDVVVLEAAELPLLGVLGPEMGAVFAQLHRDHGVDLRLGARIAEVAATGVGASAPGP